MHMWNEEDEINYTEQEMEQMLKDWEYKKECDLVFSEEYQSSMCMTF